MPDVRSAFHIIFQSTLSVRRATAKCIAHHLLICLFQSTLSVRRATPVDFAVLEIHNISIHALREESDGVGKLAM